MAISKSNGPGALMSGDMSLKRAFWLWGGVGGGGQVVVISAFMLALSDALDGFIGWAVLAWIGFVYIYFTAVLVGIWRVAGRVLAPKAQSETQLSEDPSDQRTAAWAARVMVILGAIMIFSVTFQVLFMGGSPH